MPMDPNELKRQLARQNEKTRSSKFTKSSSGSKSSNRYSDIYNDMVSDPVKYYSAFDNSSTKYKSELAYYEYMGRLSETKLPEQYTQFATTYDDLRENADSYIQQLGTQGYKAALEEYKELYGVEKTQTSQVLNLVENRVSNGFLEEKGLDKFYTYNAASPEDALLQELGYAPTSFNYSVEDIQERQQTGFKASDYYQLDKDGNMTEDGFYLSTLYNYDENDPEDMLNAALGVMPKSFKYGSSDEDKQREYSKQLPEEAELYLKNSKTFASDYTEYADKMQKYADETYEYENLPGLAKLFTAKPVNPYPSDVDIPESVKAYMEYKNNLVAQADAETDYFATKADTVKTPNFFYADDMPVSVDEFDTSEYTTKKQAAKDSVINQVPLSDLITPSMENTIDKYAQQSVENDYLEQLKASGEYDIIMQEQAEADAQITQALQEGYTPENYAAIKASDLLTRMDIVGGEDKINQLAVQALKSSEMPVETAVLSGVQLVPDADNTGANMFNKTFAFDSQIKEIKTQLDALGWKGETTSDDTQIQSLLDKAGYRVLQLREQMVGTYRETLKTMPSWLVSIANGGVKGVENWEGSMSTVAVELAKLASNNEGLDTIYGGWANDIATRSNEQAYVDQADIARSKGATEFTKNTLYSATAAAVEMGINIAIGSGIGSAVSGGAGAAASTAKTGAAKVWSTVAQKLVVNPRSAGFFVSSLGHNLMQGELEGRSDSEKWLAALPSAYFETVIEQSFGFFSGKGSPISALIKNGVKGATTRTLGNVGIALLENTVGEAIEENLQDVVNTGFRDLFYENYNPSLSGKDGYFDWDRMGDTTKTTILVGLMMSVFGLGGAVGDVRTAQQAEASFNAAVEAYKSGDTTTFNAEMKNMGTSFQKALESINMQEIDKALQGTQLDTATAQMLDEIQTAMNEAASLRIAKENGEAVSQAQLNMADARANAAINAVQVGVKGQKLQFKTLYDQVANSPELTEIVNKNGLASRLVRSNKTALSEAQVAIIKDIDAKTAQNPYIDVSYADSTTTEGLDAQRQKTTQKYMEANTELQRLVSQAQASLKAQYNIDRKAGRIEYQRQVEKIQALNKRVETLRAKSEEAAMKVDAFTTQQQAISTFAGTGVLMQNGKVIRPGVQQTIDNAGNITYNENNGGGVYANVGRGTQGEVYNGTDGRKGLLKGDGRGRSRLLLLNTTKNAYRVNALEVYSDSKGSVYALSEPAVFHDLIGDAIQSNPYGSYVHQYETAEYANKKTFVIEDGMAGVAVTEDGDIVSLYKNPASGKSGVSSSLLITALNNGGIKLDCFDGFLSKLYQSHGFVPVARTAFNEEFAPDGWNYERDNHPDIVFFAHNGDTVEQVIQRRGTYESADINSVPIYESYEEAQAARDAQTAQETAGAAPTAPEALQSTEAVEQPTDTARTLGTASTEATQEEQVAEVLTNIQRPKQTLGNWIKTGYDFAKRKFTDSGATIATLAKKSGDKLMYPLYNNAKQARMSAQAMIGESQFNLEGQRTGDSLIETFRPVTEQGEAYTKDFYTYLYHMHNIDRMAQGKPVYGKSITAEQSQTAAAELLAQHPEFEEQAQKVYAYNDNLMQWRVDSGLVTQEQADTLKEMYPHYVPTYRMDAQTTGATASGNTVSIADTVKRATGSSKPLMPINDSMARQTLQVVQAARRNILGNRLLDKALEGGSNVGEYVGGLSVEQSNYDIDAETETDAKELKNEIRIYRNGEVATMKVNTGVFEGFKALSGEQKERNILMQVAQGGVNKFKQFITGYNPVFTVRNFAKDLQDAGLYTTDIKGLVKNYPAAWKEITTNGEMWQLYKRFGATGSSFFDYDTGIGQKKQSAVAKYTVGMIEKLNMAVEQAPRLAEFISTIEKGGMSYDNIVQATYNAAEVTTNFGRSGTWGKTINSTFVPFFNPSIQGASRLIRMFTETKGVKAWTTLAIKAVALGMVPSLINALMYDGDDEYEKISQRDKDRYYLFKMSDGYWAKIPKGRVLSLLGGVATRAVNAAQGEDVEAAEFIQLAKEQVAPISPFESNIASPIEAVANNETWYGTPIESERLQNYAPGQRFDESTDAFSKWLGGWTNWSPKKINYLLDAYTGVAGDILLPMTTPEANKDPFSNAFVLDTKTKNRIASDFYDQLEDIKYRMKSTDSADAARAKKENKLIQKYSTDASELYGTIREIENSDMTDAEKLERVRDLNVTISGLQQEALKKLGVY